MVDSPTNESHSNAASRGRPFTRGNSGRKPGSKNKATLLAECFSTDEQEKLLQKAYQLALKGNVPTLIFLLKHVLPRTRPINIDLPEIQFSDDIIPASAKVLADTATGKLSPDEGANLALQLDLLGKAIDKADVSSRLDRLEALVMKRMAGQR